MKKVKNLELTTKITDYFRKYMTERGYSIWINESPYTGYSYTASKEEDKYIPTFSLEFDRSHSKYGYEVSVRDRDGKKSLYADEIASYFLNIKSNPNDEEILKEFEKLMNDIYNKYSIYSKNNRLDSRFKKLSVDNKEYFEIEEINSFRKIGRW